ncbi:MAG: hypothetical protein IJ697_04035 [Synergistaceae bacterium]|nr:hypothetical protein [Synergistaceae bacterium]
MTDNRLSENEILHMINDTGRLSALKNAGDLSSFALSAQQSNILANDVEFWKWIARNYHNSGIFSSPSSMLDYISQGSSNEEWLSRIIQGKGYEWDYMSQQRGSVKNLFDAFEAGDVANRMGSDVTQQNILTGESTEYQMKAYTSSNTPDLHNTSTDIRVVTNSEKAGAVQRKGYEVETFQDKDSIIAKRNQRLESIKRGEVQTSYTLKSTAGLMAKAGLIGCAIGITVEAIASYRAWKNKLLTDDEYLIEILKSGGNAGLTAAGTAGIMLPVSSAITAAGMSSLITIPVAFVVGSAVNKIIAPCFGRGEYRKILSQAKYYQSLENLYDDMISSMEVSSEHLLGFIQGVKAQRSFHENAKRVSMSLNKDLEALYNSI